MDKEKATKTLAGELVKANGQNFIVNSAHQKHLLEKAISYYQIEDEKPFSFKIHIGTLNDSYIKISTKALDEFTTSYKKSLTGYCSRVSDANYVFTENSQSLSMVGSSPTYSRLSLMNTLSFFALIGEKEEDDLKRLFYKDVRPDLVYAMDALNINNFIKIYRDYTSSEKSFFKKVDDFRVIKSLIGFISNLNYDKDGEVHQNRFKSDFGRDISSLNAVLERDGTGAYISPRSSGYIHKKELSNVVKQISSNYLVKNSSYTNCLNDFFSFVFSLPYEEQNIESNKEILKISKNLGFVVDIACQEYSQGKYFQEYFDVLGKDVQCGIVRALKSAPHNLAHDSFLWGKGFKDVDLDYMDLYKENADGFIDYFSSKTLEERKVILKDIMDCDSINKDVVDWLDENESELVKEVGLNG